jgi:hypothetical protein
MWLNTCETRVRGATRLQSSQQSSPTVREGWAYNGHLLGLEEVGGVEEVAVAQPKRGAGLEVVLNVFLAGKKTRVSVGKNASQAVERTICR